jgi:uncharacterized damage-inducible protein DinB
MDTKELFLGLLDREHAVSRRLLERVPTGREDWKPHPKSMAFGYLATLVAAIPDWIAMQVERDALDLAPVDGPKYTPPSWSTTEELVAALDRTTAHARSALESISEAHLGAPWKLQVAGRTVAESPRRAAIADTFCHLAHHRGQLSVYLRLLDVPLPSIYGPSADERSF